MIISLPCPLGATWDTPRHLSFLCLCPFSVGTEPSPTTPGSDPAQESTEPPVNVTVTVTATPWGPKRKVPTGLGRWRGDGNIPSSHWILKTLTTPSRWISIFLQPAEGSAAGPLMTWLWNQSWPSSWQTEVEKPGRHMTAEKIAGCPRASENHGAGKGVWSHMT